MKIHGNDHEMKDLSSEVLNKYIDECREKFPADKTYDVIYADPPWSYAMNDEKISNSTISHYPTMSLDQLKKLPVKDIGAKSSALFLWTSNPLLPKAIDLMQSWGYEFKTVFKVWRKTYQDGSPVCVPGWWSRSSTELLLVGARGSPLKNKTNLNEPQEYVSQRETHSEKPDEIRDAIFNFLDVKSRIELFSRKVCDGWDAWGLEINGFLYEGSGESSTVYGTGTRSFGTQVDTVFNIKGKIKRSSAGGGISNHKTDCTCCVCKSRARKNT